MFPRHLVPVQFLMHTPCLFGFKEPRDSVPRHEGDSIKPTLTPPFSHVLSRASYNQLSKSGSLFPIMPPESSQTSSRSVPGLFAQRHFSGFQRASQSHPSPEAGGGRVEGQGNALILEKSQFCPRCPGTVPLGP